jgi:hypothetical protein
VNSHVHGEQWRTPEPADLIFPKWHRDYPSTNRSFVSTVKADLVQLTVCGIHTFASA